MSGLPHLGQKIFDGPRCFRVLNSSRILSNDSTLGFSSDVRPLLKFNVLFWISDFYQILANSFTVVSLEEYLTIFRRSAARAKTFQFLSHSRQIRVLLINTVNNCVCPAKFARFKPYTDSLLFLLYFAADTQIFR